MEDFSAEVETLHKGVDGIKGCFLAGGAITSVFTNRKIRDITVWRWETGKRKPSEQTIMLMKRNYRS